MALHYTGCGLPNVWLKSGFKAHETKYGVAYSYEDIDGLYSAITVRLCASQQGLTPDVLRFLRKRLGYSQRELGAELGYTSQAVAKWEKGTSKIPLAVTQLVRLLCLNKFSPHTPLHVAFEENSTLSSERLEFEYSNSKWKVAQVIKVITDVRIQDTPYIHQINCATIDSRKLVQRGVRKLACHKAIPTIDLSFTAFFITQKNENILPVLAGASDALDTYGCPATFQKCITTATSPATLRNKVLDINTVTYGAC